MSERRKLVAGNWKMHGSLARNRDLLAEVLAGCEDLSCDVLVCPPYPYLAQVQAMLSGTRVALGAQNLSEYAEGAFTGEVAPAMLADFGCSHVLVGHSERRSLYGESDAVVVGKFAAAQRAGLVPVLCVGETLAEREAGNTMVVVGRQLLAVVDKLGVETFAQAVVAYEPVWAIGTGLTATPQQVQEVHAEIRALLCVRDASIAAKVLVLYGGSVKPQNAAELFGQPDVDGGLVGGAALVASDFLAICRAVN